MRVLSTAEDGHGNVVEQIIDHGDGTATRTTYHPDGSVAEVVELSGLPIPPPPVQPTASEELETLPLAEGRAVIAARKLILNAGDFWEALLVVDEADPEHTQPYWPLLDVLVGTLLEAALPLVED